MLFAQALEIDSSASEWNGAEVAITREFMAKYNINEEKHGRKIKAE